MRPTMMPRRGTVTTPSPASTSKSGGAPPALARATSTGQVPVSKHRAAFQAILRGGTGSAGSTEDADRAKDPERFYFDLFCLAVDRSFLANLVEAVPTSALIESGSTKVRQRHRELARAARATLKLLLLYPSAEQRAGAVLLCCQVPEDVRRR